MSETDHKPPAAILPRPFARFEQSMNALIAYISTQSSVQIPERAMPNLRAYILALVTGEIPFRQNEDRSSIAALQAAYRQAMSEQSPEAIALKTQLQRAQETRYEVRLQKRIEGTAVNILQKKGEAINQKQKNALVSVLSNLHEGVPAYRELHTHYALLQEELEDPQLPTIAYVQAHPEKNILGHYAQLLTPGDWVERNIPWMERTRLGGAVRKGGWAENIKDSLGSGRRSPGGS